MIKIFQIIIFVFASLSLTACVTTADRQQQENDKIIAAQVKAMSPAQRNKFCAKLQSNHNRYRQKIIPIIWQNLSQQKNNKLTYKQVSKTWLTLVNQHDSHKLGKEFSFYKRNMLLNLHYGLIANCSWMNQQAV